MAAARVVSIPLRTKFRGMTERELLIFEGPNGWSEWAAFPEYEDEEATVWLEAALEWGYGELPKPKRTHVKVNAILPAINGEEISKVLSRAGKFETCKIKVAEQSQDLSLDLERIQEVKQLHPEAKIRLDANGAWDARVAARWLNRAADCPIEFIEQPCFAPAKYGVTEVRRMEDVLRGLAADYPTPIALDESLVGANDIERWLAADWRGLWVIKPALLGDAEAVLAQPLTGDRARFDAALATFLKSPSFATGQALAGTLRRYGVWTMDMR
jgi:O-succinylbenzoate synthase